MNSSNIKTDRKHNPLLVAILAFAWLTFIWVLYYPYIPLYLFLAGFIGAIGISAVIYRYWKELMTTENPQKKDVLQRSGKRNLGGSGWILVLDRMLETLLISHTESVHKWPPFESEILGSTISFSS